MEITVGIDVSKAGLDVHVHPSGESFAAGNPRASNSLRKSRAGRTSAMYWSPAMMLRPNAVPTTDPTSWPVERAER